MVNVIFLSKFIFFHKEGKFINSKVFLKMPQPKQSPVRKSLNDVKVKYSPVKKQDNKYNNVFVKGYKDAYYKDFLDLLDTDPKVGNDLGIIKVALLGIQASAVLPKFKVLDTRLAIS
jgi:hypothetical protein